MCAVLTCFLRSEHGVYIGQEVEPPTGSGGNLRRLQGEVKYHMELNTKDLYKAKIKQRVLLVAICYDYL